MLKLEYKDYTLDFKFEAGTSRGVMSAHYIYLIRIEDTSNPGLVGFGEVAPLPQLSPETFEELQEHLDRLQSMVSQVSMPRDREAVFHLVERLVPENLPSLRFGLEMAFLDFQNGGRRLIFDNDFVRGKRDIQINGLIWMGEKRFMNDQIDAKLQAGYKCIKVKVGAIDFAHELDLVRRLRESSDKLIIRLDANGAFPTNEVFARLSALEPFGIHSIEQPIMPKQWEAMQLICQRSEIPIALDEELIGITNPSQKQELLKLLRPNYLVLKPTLLGGFRQTQDWIRLAEQLGIGWWVTSALESNLGLNAIAQFVGEFPKTGYHGLGTGQLYTNNFSSPLVLNGEYLGYDASVKWDSTFDAGAL